MIGYSLFAMIVSLMGLATWFVWTKYFPSHRAMVIIPGLVYVIHVVMYIFILFGDSPSRDIQFAVNLYTLLNFALAPIVMVLAIRARK